MIARSLKNPLAEIVSQVTDDLVKKVIEGVMSDFIWGHKLYLDFGASHQPKDDYYTWSANRIAGSKLSAGAGPKSRDNMSDFLANTVFNPQIPVKHIVAFGSCLAEDASLRKDFFDYAIRERVEAFGDYRVNIQRISGEPEFNDEGQVLPCGIIQSLLTVTRLGEDGKSETRELSVTVFDVPDNNSLYLGGGQREIDERTPPVNFLQSCDVRKEVLWQLARISSKERMFVHCAAGYGRTGHFIAMVEMLKNYRRIFGSFDPDAIIQNIRSMVERIRKNRPWLLLVPEQLQNAILNTVIIYRYALEKGYVDQNVQSNTAAMLARLTMMSPQESVSEEKQEASVQTDPVTPSTPTKAITGSYYSSDSGSLTLFNVSQSVVQPLSAVVVTKTAAPSPSPFQ